MALDADLGLVLTSTNTSSTRSLAIQNSSNVYVPFEGVSNDGDLVKATWWGGTSTVSCAPAAGSNRYAQGIIAHGYAWANVSLPPPLRASVGIAGAVNRTNPPFMVPPGGPAAAAGLPFQGNIVVELEFPNDRRIDFTTDPRTILDLSGLNEMFTVANGSRTIKSVANKGLGSGFIHVSFTHTNLTAKVQVELAAFKDLVAMAKPYPPYDGSTNVAADALSPITGSIPLYYEQAVMDVDMVLTNNFRFPLKVAQCSFSLAAAGSNGGSATDVAIVDGEHVQGQCHFESECALLGVCVCEGGLTTIVAEFAGENTTYDIGITSYEVSVVSVDSVVVRQDTRDLGPTKALRGIKDAAYGQTLVNVTCSNGRKLSLFSNEGVPLIPGLATFFNGSAPAASVHGTSGRVTLHGNHWNPAIVIASVTGAAGAQLNRSTYFPTNLWPTDADGDLGQTEGFPLPTRLVGEEILVPLHLHTSDEHVGTFDIHVVFDSTMMSIEDPAQAVTFNANSSIIASGILDAVVGGNDLHLSGSIDSKTFEGPNVLLVNIKFTALRAGTTSLGGLVEVLGSTSLPAQNVAQRGHIFVAGQVYQVITSSRRERRNNNVDWNNNDAPALVGGPGAEWVDVLDVDLNITSHRIKDAYSRAGVCVQQEIGDTNSDCYFDVNDVRFVTQYLAYRGIGFVGGYGPFIKSIVDGNAHSRNALDADHNANTNVRDAAFLNKVNLGILVFVEGLTVDNTGCMTTLSAELYAKGNLPVAVTRAALYFDLGNNDGAPQYWAIDRMIPTIGTLVVDGKSGNGVLIAAECTEVGGVTSCQAELEGVTNAADAVFSLGPTPGQVVLQTSGLVKAFFMSGQYLQHVLGQYLIGEIPLWCCGQCGEQSKFFLATQTVQIAPHIAALPH